MLKAGCVAERTTFRTAAGLQRDIAIKSVITWRLMVLTLLGREVPELEAELLFTAPELNFLRDYAQEYGVEAPDDLGGGHAIGGALRGAQGQPTGPTAGLPDDLERLRQADDGDGRAPRALKMGRAEPDRELTGIPLSN